MTFEKFVGLVRVSTQRQGESGLGLEAGIKDLEDYVSKRDAVLTTVFKEVESGRHDDLIDRPTLMKALTLCKRQKACLLIPKVDRLVRSTCVHTDIKRSGVSFRACDNPEANEFTLDILVAVAAQEGRQISDRTKRALAAYKARGGLLGSHLVGCHLTDEGRDKGREKGNRRQRREAVEVYADLIDDLVGMRKMGRTLQELADWLNGEGHTTRTGSEWGPTQVSRLLKRVAA